MNHRNVNTTAVNPKIHLAETENNSVGYIHQQNTQLQPWSKPMMRIEKITLTGNVGGNRGDGGIVGSMDL